MLFDLPVVHALAVLATYMFAATAKGITGLGFSTTCLPILALIIGLKEALPLVIIPSIWSNLWWIRRISMYGQSTLPRCAQRRV